jgi:hypothetical protein
MAAETLTAVMDFLVGNTELWTVQVYFWVLTVMLS